VDGVLHVLRALSIDAPSLCVDTTEEYRPSLDEIVAFVGD